ncbi:hypothetical protein ACFRMQ_36655 [Kitasatospora sp. NPDC056783]|uniref:hypothetical protein n=1 Tax=Kitasatospora sp. NPDC056783 TaxID=3345943 RepID=UPI00367C9088
MSGPKGSWPGDRPIVSHGENRGIISSGDNATNVVYIDSRFTATPSLLDLPIQQLDLLKPPLRRRLFGREELVEQVTDQLNNGRSVQLYGLSGVGKQAIALEVNGRLGAHGLRGTVLLPQAGPPDTLAAVYDRLARRIFGKDFLRGVDEDLLRAAVTRVTTHLTIVDCALTGEDLTRLLHCFPGCTFLLTSPYRTLPNDPGAIHHVQPLAPSPAAELLSAELGLPLGPVGLQNLQFNQAYRMAEGQPQRLLQYAAFIRNFDDWRARSGEAPFDHPGPTDTGQVSPQQQAEILAAALSEPARQVLVALATFQAPLHAAWFAAVTGNPHATASNLELFDRGLVTLHGDGHEHRITADAAVAVGSQGWPPTSATTAAEGIIALLASAKAAGTALPPPDPYLLVAVAHGLNSEGKRAQVSGFVRVTAPLALRAGHRRAALQLYALGRRAASQAGLTDDIEFYLRTGEQTRKLLDGDAIAAVTALAFLASSAGQAALTTATGAGQSAWAWHVAHHATQIWRRLVEFAQVKPAVAVATTVVLAGGAMTAVVVATNGSPDKIAAECSVARDASKAGLNIKVTTPQGLVAFYRASARDLQHPSSEITIPKLKEAIQKRADELNGLADNQARAGNEFADERRGIDSSDKVDTGARIEDHKARSVKDSLAAISSYCDKHHCACADVARGHHLAPQQSSLVTRRELLALSETPAPSARSRPVHHSTGLTPQHNFSPDEDDDHGLLPAWHVTVLRG